MQRYIAALCALVVLACVTGCGGGSSTSEPVLLPTVALKAADFYGKTFYVTPIDATALNGYLELKFSPTGDVVQWSSTPVKTGEPALDTSGTWNETTIATDKILILTTPTVTRKFTLIQKEVSYWLAYDDGTFKTSRLYFEIPSLPSGSALTLIQAYQAFIAAIVAPSATPNAVKLGGSIQGTPTAPLNAVFNNVSTVAGLLSDPPAPGYAEGIGTAAIFNQPTGITTDGTYLYVVDRLNYVIRKINMVSKAVTLLAGTPGVAGITNSYDGTGYTANFTNPNDVTVYGTYLYVADTGNNAIRRVDTSSGVVTLIAGSTSAASGAVDSLNGTDARFNQPTGITTDGTNLYVADYGNHTIRKIVISTGAVVTLAGSAQSPGSSDSSDGTGATARFNFPARITTDGTNLYVTDFSNCTVRKVVIATGVVSTLAGSAGLRDSVDGVGATARFYQPNGITADGTYLYVTDSYAIGTDKYSSIRRLEISTGIVSTVVRNRSGSANGSIATASFYSPTGITANGISLYVADTSNNLIRRISP